MGRRSPILLSLFLFAACAAPTAMEDPAPQHTHHSLDYLEITVTDMDAAKRFYAEAFDWEFNDYGPTYAGIRKGEGEVGGLRLDDTVQRGGPLPILYSADLDATVESVRAAGGEIVAPIFDFPGGRRFHFLDSSGNELAVWGAAASG